MSCGSDEDKTNASGMTRLHAAAAAAPSDMGEIIDELLRRMTLFMRRWKTSRGNTALHVAAHSASRDAVRRLLDSGFDVDECNYEGWTPLQLAASRNKPEVCSRTRDSRSVPPSELLRSGDCPGQRPSPEARISRGGQDYAAVRYHRSSDSATLASPGECLVQADIKSRREGSHV